MNNRTFISLAAAALALASQSVSADNWKHDRDDWGRDRGRGPEYARVVDVEPLVRRERYAVPVQQCWVETRYRDEYIPSRGSSAGAALLGGAAGAVIGNRFGRGDGRAAATVAGAALGAVIGHEAGRRNDDRGYYDEPQAHEVERCRTRQEVRYEERVVAYRVSYVYRGRQLVTDMPYDPGRRVRVGVDVHPRY